MKLGSIFRAEYSSRSAGVILVAMGLYIIIFTTHINAGLASLIIGIITFLIVSERTVESEIAISGMKCGIRPLNSLISDLNLKGKGVMVPPGGNLNGPRVFVPAGKERVGLPDLYDEMTVVTGDAGRVGISLEPPGLPLFAEAADRMETKVTGMEGAREIMGMLSHGMGLARSFSVRQDGDTIFLRISHGMYGDYCQYVRERSPEVCQKTGCPLCSAYMVAISDALSQPLRITEFEMEGEHAKFTLKVL